MPLFYPEVWGIIVVIGVCQLTFHLPGNRTLKGKRQMVRRICERVRNRFHISIAEVDDLEMAQQACLGLTLVGNEARVLESVMSQILHFIDQMQIAPIIDQQIEIVHYERMFQSDRPLLDVDALEPDEPVPAKPKPPPQPKNNPWAYLDEWED